MKLIFKIVGGIILFSLLAFLLGWIIMWLWNWLVPELFNGPVITYWQAWGLFILSRILFGSWGKGGHKHKGEHGWKKGWDSNWKNTKSDYWKKRLERKLAGMTPEEREAYTKRMKERCGWAWDDEPQTPPNEQQNNA
ncbi:MAG: hypothetical protein ACRC3B_20360 [Bacteroidia bacterium]